MRNSLSPAFSSLVRNVGLAAVCALAAVAVFAVVPFASTGSPSKAGSASPEPTLPHGAGAVEELEGLRTASTRTYALADGRRLTKVFAGEVNYRDGGGAWRAIDLSLVGRAAGGLGVAAAGFDLALPARSDGPVRVGKGGAWVEFSLRDAATAVPRRDGQSVEYADVLPGVDVRYRALGNGVKESLVLADRSAPARLAFDLKLAEGLEPVKSESGEIELRDGQGKLRMSLAAPWMQDAAGQRSEAVAYELERSGAGWLLVVEADERWLGDPARRFPVTVDPTVYVSPTLDCMLASSSPTSSYCSAGTLRVGTDAGWPGEGRSILKFDLSSIPRGARMDEAYLSLYQSGQTGTATKDFGVHRLTRAFTSAASWNQADATTSWTSAGGDFAPDAYFVKSIGGGSSGFWTSWAMTKLAQQWLDGAQPNHGLLLKEATTGNNRIEFESSDSPYTDRRPYLGVTYNARVGAARQFALADQPLSDRMGISVNVANGNLIHRADDVRIAGTGLDLNVARAFNNLDNLPDGNVGRDWQLSVGSGARLEYSSGNSRTFVDPSGTRSLFWRKPDGSFESPTAVDATLTVEGSGHKLHFDKTEQHWHFNADGDLTRQEDRNANTISYSYSAPGKLNTITDSQGRVITTSYHSSGKLASLADWAGRTWSYSYDSSGRLTGYTDPDSKSTAYAYQGPDDLVSITDPRGAVTKLEYDSDSRVTAIKRNYKVATNSWTALWSFAYSSPSAPCNSASDVAKTVVTDPRGKATTYCSDLEARITKTVDPNGNTREGSYTPNSDPATATAPGSAQTTFGYAANNLTSVDQPAGESTAMEYTNPAHPRSVTKATSPQGTSQVFAYDTPGNTTTVSDAASPAQVEAKLEYNGQSGGACADDPTTKPGTLRCAIDGKGNQTLYGYDDDGNLTSITPELPLGDTTITYDSLSRIETVEDGKGQTRTYSYDPLDRVTQIEYSNGDTIVYDYDHNGNRTDRDDSVHGSSNWTHDGMNRRLQDTLPSGTTTYSWDAASNLSSLTDPGGTVNYGYDDANRLTSLAEPGGSCTSPVSLCTTFGYTTRDQRSSTVYPNGVTQSVTYDASDKPTNITAVKAGAPPTTLTNFTYNYDLPSPSTAKSELLQWATDKNNNKTTYGYDFLARLTSAVEKNSGGTTIDNRSWEYDLASNRKRQVINATTTSYAYNDANELCWEYTGTSTNACGSPPSGATTFAHDANGNMTASSAALALAYNIKDHTTSWTPPGGGATSFAYAGPGQTERTSTGGTTEHNTLLGLTRGGSTEWTRDPGGTLIAQNAGGTRHYYLADRLGSIVGLTNSSGTVAQTYDYDAYGLTRASSGSVTNPFQYTGEYRHHAGNAGRYKIGARYYATSIGRWTQQDPIDQAGDLREGNRYAYVGGDPVNLTDPSGEALPAVAAVAAAGALRYGIVRAGASAAAQGARAAAGRAVTRAQVAVGTRARNAPAYNEIREGASKVVQGVRDVIGL